VVEIQKHSAGETNEARWRQRPGKSTKKINKNVLVIEMSTLAY